MHSRHDITGLVLAGGAARRMQGVNKALVPWRGEPLVQHALRRLRAQVGPVMVSANRDLGAFAKLGVSVVTDAAEGTPSDASAHRHSANPAEGPLHGWLSGLQSCRTRWLLTVPCDSPLFPLDLAERMLSAVRSQACDAAVAWATRWPHAQAERPEALSMQPMFCLLSADLAAPLRQRLALGGLSARSWLESLRSTAVPFDTDVYGPLAFANANTADDLHRLSCLYELEAHERQT